MKDKIIFITGATSGIGEGCARKFASEGANLILNGRNQDKLNELKVELEADFGIEVLLLPFDVRDRERAKVAIESLEGKWKSIDVLVNNAGLVIGFDKEFEGVLEEWDIVIDTNIKGLLNITRLVTPGMVQRGVGHIINIGSIAGDAAYPGGSVYCATKAAVKTLSDGLRQDLVDTLCGLRILSPDWLRQTFRWYVTEVIRRRQIISIKGLNLYQEVMLPNLFILRLRRLLMFRWQKYWFLQQIRLLQM
jgi:Short-chain alcohol dehydrogenase of unknown specificity